MATGGKQYLPWELTLGDGAYRQCSHVLAKYPANTNYLYDPRSRKRDIVIALHPFQQAHNGRLNHNRQRIEHIVGLINKKRKPLTGKWQGEWAPLIDAVNVVCQLTQLQILRASKNGTAANGYSRYTGLIGRAGSRALAALVAVLRMMLYYKSAGWWGLGLWGWLPLALGLGCAWLL